MSEDIVQEGFMKILGSKEEFLDWHHARRYLCGCIRNAAFERLNKETRLKAIVRDFIDPAPSIAVEITINFFKLKAAISRTIIKEIYYNNRSRREIAKEYSISREAVSRYERKALKELALVVKLVDA